MNYTLPDITYFTLTLEVFLGLFLLSHMFPLRKRRFFRGFAILYFVLDTAVMLLQNYWLPRFFSDTYAFYLSLHIFMLFLYTLIFCVGKLIFKIFLPLVFVSMITLAGFPARFIPVPFSFFSDDYPKIAGSLVLILVTVFMLYFKIDTQKPYPFSYYLIMTAAPILNMVSITLLKEYMGVFPYVNLVRCFTFVLELLIYYMIWQSTKEYAQNIQLRLIQQQQQYQAQHMEQLRDIVADYHHLRHDMKNHIACMDRLLSQEKYDDLKKYFYSLSKDIYALDNQIETGNEIVNQVINMKYATSRRLNIPMEIQAAIPKTLDIPDHLLCSVLSNLLDNAIEASAKIQNPEISIKVTMVKGYLSITVQNRIEEWQRETALSHKTTKSKPQLHGLGLSIVQETVQKYNGISSFEIENDIYTASIMLELSSP